MSLGTKIAAKKIPRTKNSCQKWSREPNLFMGDQFWLPNLVIIKNSSESEEPFPRFAFEIKNREMSSSLRLPLIPGPVMVVITNPGPVITTITVPARICYIRSVTCQLHLYPEPVITKPAP